MKNNNEPRPPIESAHQGALIESADRDAQLPHSEPERL